MRHEIRIRVINNEGETLAEKTLAITGMNQHADMPLGLRPGQDARFPARLMIMEVHEADSAEEHVENSRREKEKESRREKEKESRRGRLFLITNYDEMGTPRHCWYRHFGPDALDRLLRSDIVREGGEVAEVTPDEFGGVEVGKPLFAVASQPPLELKDTRL